MPCLMENAPKPALGLLACLLLLAATTHGSPLGLDIPSSILSSTDSAELSNEPMVMAEATGRPVPLKHREVRAQLLADVGVSSVTESMRFQAPSAPIQVTFKFPLPPAAAVFRFEASIGDRMLKTRVKEKAEAKTTFEQAVQQGHSAVHMEQASHSNIYTVSLGNLGAGEECIVHISYIRLLNTVANSLEWTHTSTWVPPYSGSARDQDPANVQQNQKATPLIDTQVSYSLSYDVCIVSEADIESVESREKIQVTKGTKEDSCQGIVKLTSEVSDPGRDFSLHVDLKSKATRTQPSLSLQQTTRDGTTKRVGLASFPILPAEEDTSKAQYPSQLKQELYLVVDCSGSMDGEPRRFAHKAALFFVQNLPHDQEMVKFNIYAYGSSFRSMNPEGSLDFNELTKAEAINWINSHIPISLGGTNLYTVLDHIYKQPIPEGYDRQIIFMTDGAVSSSEEEYISKLVSTSPQARHTTVMTMGIGDGIHRALLERMSSLTGGVTQYVQAPQDIVRSCSFLQQSALSKDAVIDVKLVPRSCLLRMVPVPPPRLFVGQTLRMLFDVIEAESGASLELNAQRKDGTPVRMAVPIPPTKPATYDANAIKSSVGGKEAQVSHVTGDALTALHALAYIGSLLEGTSPMHISPDGSTIKRDPDELEQMVKQQVVQLAIQENLVTPYTSSVGVLLRPDPVNPKQSIPMEVSLKMPQGRGLWGTDHASDDGSTYGYLEHQSLKAVPQSEGQLLSSGSSIWYSRKSRPATISHSKHSMQRYMYTPAASAQAPAKTHNLPDFREALGLPSPYEQWQLFLTVIFAVLLFVVVAVVWVYRTAPFRAKIKSQKV